MVYRKRRQVGPKDPENDLEVVWRNSDGVSTSSLNSGYLGIWVFFPPFSATFVSFFELLEQTEVS